MSQTLSDPHQACARNVLEKSRRENQPRVDPSLAFNSSTSKTYGSADGNEAEPRNVRSGNTHQKENANRSSRKRSTSRRLALPVKKSNASSSNSQQQQSGQQLPSGGLFAHGSSSETVYASNPNRESNSKSKSFCLFLSFSVFTHIRNLFELCQAPKLEAQSRLPWRACTCQANRY